MNRRLFFRALAGGTASASVAPPAAKPRPALVVGTNGFCVCGGAMIAFGNSWDGSLYWECSAPGCPQYQIPIRPPRVAAELADPAVVRQVRAELQAAAELRRRAKEEERRRQEEEQRRRERARPHGLYEISIDCVWDADRQRWVDGRDWAIASAIRPLTEQEAAALQDYVSRYPGNASLLMRLQAHHPGRFEAWPAIPGAE